MSIACTVGEDGMQVFPKEIRCLEARSSSARCDHYILRLPVLQNGYKKSITLLAGKQLQFS
jgi:hypothetical protein